MTDDDIDAGFVSADGDIRLRRVGHLRDQTDRVRNTKWLVKCSDWSGEEVIVMDKCV